MAAKKKKYDGVIKCKEVIYFTVSEGDLEEFIKHHTGRLYDIHQGEQPTSTTERSFCVEPKPDMEDYQEWLSTGEGHFKLENILNFLCSQGLLTKGSYLVNRGW